MEAKTENAAKWRELVKLTESMKQKLRAVRFAMSSSMKLLEKIREEEDAIKDEQLEQVNNDGEENLGLQFAQKLLSNLRKDYEVALKAKTVAETEWRNAMIKLTEYRARTTSWWTMKVNPEPVHGKRHEISRGPVVTGARFGTGATGLSFSTGATGIAYATGVTGAAEMPAAMTGIRRPRGPITTGSKHDDLAATASTGTVASATEQSVSASTGGATAAEFATASTGSALGIKSVTASTGGATAAEFATASTGSAAAKQSVAASTGGATAAEFATASTGSAATKQSVAASTGGATAAEFATASTGSAAAKQSVAAPTGGATAAEFATASTGSAAAKQSVAAPTGGATAAEFATASTGSAAAP